MPTSASVPRISLALLGLLATVAACGSGPGEKAISAARYDRACTTAADCVFVYDGPTACCGVGCANSAIAARALAKYTGDLVNAEEAACSGTSAACSGLATGGDRGTVSVCPGPGRIECLAGECVFDAPDASTPD